MASSVHPNLARQEMPDFDYAERGYPTTALSIAGRPLCW